MMARTLEVGVSDRKSTASSPEELVVSLRRATALINLIGTTEWANALSSAIPVSGLAGAGLADSTGLTGDAGNAPQARSAIVSRSASSPRQTRCAQCADLALAASFGHYVDRADGVHFTRLMLRCPAYPGREPPGVRADHP